MKDGLIHRKIIAIMNECGAIEKGRKNVQQGYNFRGIDDVYATMQPLLAKHGVFVVPNVISHERHEGQTKSGGTLNYSVIHIEYKFFADDGSFVGASVIGEGMDSGDKASNKAMSVAQKYAFLQVFSIPTLDAKDPENDSHSLSSEHKISNVSKAAPKNAAPAADCDHKWFVSKFNQKEEYCSKCRIKRERVA